MNKNMRKIITISLTVLILMTLTSCKLPFKSLGKDKDKTTVSMTVPITPGYISDRVNYETAKILADKFGISMTDDDLKAYIESNYSQNDTIEKSADLLTSPTAMKQIVGETAYLHSYAQVYVETKIRDKIKAEESSMTQEEIEEYKSKYKEYLDKIGIPESERDSYVVKLKETYVIQQKIDTERLNALNEAVEKVFSEYRPVTSN